MKYLLGSLTLLSFLLSGCPLPELGGDGQPCFDSVDPCDQGLVCRPIDDLCIYPECTPADPDCGPDEHCDFNEYACKPGEPIGCDGDWDCPDGHYCDMDDLQCKPEGTGPDGSLGDPCPIDQIHLDKPECKSGLECIWISWGTCYSGNPDECWLVPHTMNSVCHEDACKGSFCAESCSGYSCGYGFIPVEVGDADCFCAPVPPSHGCDPMNNQDCDDERCLPLPYDSNYTYCVPVGYVSPGVSCDYNIGDYCGRGHICMGICTTICELDYPVCLAGECVPLPGDAWGFCSEMP